MSVWRKKLLLLRARLVDDALPALPCRCDTVSRAVRPCPVLLGASCLYSAAHAGQSATVAVDDGGVQFRASTVLVERSGAEQSRSREGLLGPGRAADGTEVAACRSERGIQLGSRDEDDSRKQHGGWPQPQRLRSFLLQTKQRIDGANS